MAGQKHQAVLAGSKYYDNYDFVTMRKLKWEKKPDLGSRWNSLATPVPDTQKNKPRTLDPLSCPSLPRLHFLPRLLPPPLAPVSWTSKTSKDH